jgi:hypothetical protein
MPSLSPRILRPRPTELTGSGVTASPAGAAARTPVRLGLVKTIRQARSLSLTELMHLSQRGKFEIFRDSRAHRGRPLCDHRRTFLI